MYEELTKSQSIILKKLISRMDNEFNVHILAKDIPNEFPTLTTIDVQTALSILHKESLISLFLDGENISACITPDGRSYFEAIHEWKIRLSREQRMTIISSLISGFVMLVAGFLLGKYGDNILNWIVKIFS